MFRAGAYLLFGRFLNALRRFPSLKEPGLGTVTLTGGGTETWVSIITSSILITNKCPVSGRFYIILQKRPDRIQTCAMSEVSREPTGLNFNSENPSIK